MKYLAVIFSVILFKFALAAPDLLGKDECTYGPSYWCSQISKAKKCGAVQHCMQTVWKNQIIKPKDTMQCKLCNIGLDEVRAMLKKNGTEEEIKKYLAEVCHVITNPDMKAKCESAVTKDLPVILALLKSSMTTEQICATMGLCTGFEDTVQHKAVSHDVKVNTADVCGDCTRFFTDVQNMIISNETQEVSVKQIEDLLKQTLCSQLGPVQGMCDFVVDEYIPQILQFMGQTVDPQTACRIIGFCTKGDIFTAIRIRMKLIKLLKQFNQKSIGGQEECDTCKAVMADVQALDQDATTQDKIKDFVKKELCTRLRELQNDCINLVDEYAPIFFELMANELDPETVCSFVGFCRTSLGKTRKQSVEVLSLVPATPIQAVKPVKTSGAFCEVCKLAMAYLDKVLTKNATKQQIEAALDEVCSRLPGKLSSECTAFINQYASAILALLEQELDPIVICDKLGLCTPLKLHKKSGIKSSVECVLCEYVMSEIKKLISKNKSREAIEHSLDKVCDLMPSTISRECTSFVQQYGPMIIKLLLNEVEPEKVCTLINLCTSTVKKTLPRPAVSGILLRGEPIFNKKSGAKSSPRCALCEFLMREIDSLISQNKSKEAIEQALDKVCDLMPSTISRECTSFVQQYGPEIIKLLLNEVKPEEVCTLIKLCTSTVKKTLPRPAVSGILLRGEPIFNKRKPVKSPETCLVCETVLNFVAEALKENKTEAAIMSLLKKACKELPSSMSDECQGLLIAFGPEIVKMLQQDIDPKQICTELGICKSAKINRKQHKIKDEIKNVLSERQQILDSKLYFRPAMDKLGQKKCSYGPSYWCDSMKNAKECGMVEHCKAHEWGKNKA